MDTVALTIGIYYARIDRSAPGPSPTVPWPGWLPVRFDRTDPGDPDCQFSLTVDGSAYRVASLAVGGLLSADFTEFGGGVCQGFFLKPNDDWGANEQWSGWELGAGGPSVILVQYPGDRLGQCSPSLTVVRL